MDDLGRTAVGEKKLEALSIRPPLGCHGGASRFFERSPGSSFDASPLSPHKDNHMKFLAIFQHTPGAPPPSPEKLAEIGAFTQKMMASGSVFLTGGMVRPTHGLKIQSEGGQVSVLDGPFAETKELIDGFAILNAPDLKAAIELSKEFLAVAGDGKGEILPIYEGGPPPS
jgi:hypothetical protein